MSNFDAAVIGSSPICIMKAVELKKKGFNVVVIDKNNTIGGAWATANVKNIGEVEVACHLIEFYGGAYDKIGNLLDIEFITKYPQPINIYKNSKKQLYISKYLILKFFVHNLFIYLASVFIRKFNNITTNRMYIKKSTNVDLVSLKDYLLLLFFKRVLFIFRSTKIKYPKGGYKIIPKKLQEALDKNKIDKIFEDVKTIKIKDNSCIIPLKNELLSVNKVYLSESTEINISHMFEHERIRQSGAKAYTHVLVEINSPECDQTPHYISFPDNDIFHRITTHPVGTEKAHKLSMFLIQLRDSIDTYEDLTLHISDIFFKCGIIQNKQAIITIVDTFEYCYYSASADCKYPHGKYLNNVVIILQTIGDLGKIVAHRF